MKSVLILAYDFPPYHSIAAQRPGSWFRYFRDMGIEPVVITRHWDSVYKSHIDCFKSSLQQNVTEENTDNGIILRVPYRENLRDKILIQFGDNRLVWLRKILSLIYRILRFHFSFFDSTAPIFDAAKAYLSKNKCDVIIATGEPFILFKYGHLLSKTFDIPWIADYRDGWTTPVIQKKTNFFEGILNAHERKLEKKYISNTIFVTTASPSYQNALEQLKSGKKIEVIFNGFDDETFDSLPLPFQKNQQFEIAYAGILYPHQKLEMFLRGLKMFITDSGAENVKVIFYGARFYPDQEKRIFSFDDDLKPFLETTGRMSYQDVMQRLQKANVLLLLSSSGISWLNAKIFDYLSLKKIILLVQNDHGILKQILDECYAGQSFEDSDEVSKFLLRLYQEFSRTGKVMSHTKGYQKYSRRNQSKILVDLIRNNLQNLSSDS